MGTNETGAQSGQVVNDEAGLVVLSPNGVAIWESMLGSIPEADGGGIESILEAVASAVDVNGLDRAWQSSNGRALVNIPIQINSAAQMPSDFESGFGIYVILRGARLDTGEAMTFISGAGSIVIQIAQACALEARNPGKVFPFRAVLREAKKAQPGKNPAQHLEIIR